MKTQSLLRVVMIAGLSLVVLGCDFLPEDDDESSSEKNTRSGDRGRTFNSESSDCSGGVVDYESCLNCSCDEEYYACESNTACVDLSNCLYDCTDESCYEECFSTYPDGVDDRLDYEDCVIETCDKYLDDETGDTEETPVTVDGTGQGDCRDVHCSEQILACDSSPGCNCRVDCGSDDVCLYQCDNDHGDDGRDAWDALDKCERENCQVSS